MSQLDPSATSVGDILTASLKECGAIGVGQTPLAEDITDAWARLQWMLQEWNRKRWLCYYINTQLVTSTGAMTYTVGPGGDFDTGPGSMRPDKLENGNFLRQLQNSQPNQIDYPLELLQSREDYNAIALKSLNSFPQWIYYEPQHPLGLVYVWPVAQRSIYAIALAYKQVLPSSFSSLATTFNLPFEYYNAIVTNLALRLRPKYGITAKPGDLLPGMAKDALLAVRGANTAIKRLTMPDDLNRSGIYNIFSDRVY